MAEQEEEQSTQKEYPQISNQYLTLLEQRFIGGSERVDGKLYGLQTAIEDYEKGKGSLPVEYSKTLAQIRDGDSIEDIVDQRRTHYLTGMLGMFGLSGVDVFSDGYEQVMQLPVDYEETGAMSYGWKIVLHSLRVGQSDVNPEVLSKLKLEGQLQKIFHLDYTNEAVNIRLKTWEEYNEI